MPVVIRPARRHAIKVEPLPRLQMASSSFQAIRTPLGVLSQSSLDSALAHGPVVLGVQWTLGGGHAITISGGSGGNYRGHDPEGYAINVNYAGLTTYEPPYASGRYTGKWTQSVYTNSGTARKLPIVV